VLIGNSGTGKSHLLIGIGTAIAEHGLRVRYTTAANLVNELAEAHAEKRLSRTLHRYSRYDLLAIDEFSYLNLDKIGMKLLFQISRSVRNAKRLRWRPTPVFGVGKTFTDERLCSAIVDRLTFNGYLIETGADSHRLKSALEQQH
jgi:DNA replication protein DnaC